MDTKLRPVSRTQGTQHFDARVTAHFHASAGLYKLWSPEGHLHFGYWAWPMNPFRRRSMLEALVHHTVKELEPCPGKRFADLGCGYGNAARLVAGTYGARVEAFTVVEEQAHEGAIAALIDGTYERVGIHLRDFRDTALPDASLDGAYALESMCYGTGPTKTDVILEAARVLKPGARLAVADGFLVKQPTGFRKRVVDIVAKGWAVPCFPELNEFKTTLEANGFTDVKVGDWSLRMGPCALHGIPLLAWAIVRQFFRKGQMDALEKAHLRSCGLGILLGTQHDLFRYCKVTATRM